MSYVLKGQGLHTFRNELNVPDGALEVADNVVIDEDDVLECRRGFNGYGTLLPTKSDRVKQLLTYKNSILRHYNTTLQYDSGNGEFKSFDGTFSELEEGLRIKYVEANGNLFFTSIDGVKKISAKESSEFTENPKYVSNAGGVKALDFDTRIVDVLGFLKPDHQVAYRVVWGTKDINGNLILGSPSNRTLADNVNATDANVEISVQVPKDVTDKHFVQLYRTATVESTMGEDLSGDEMNLVDERPYVYNSTNLFEFKDETLDELRASAVPLYTNPISGEGIAQANDRPPVSKDITLFRGSLFYANTRTHHRRLLNLLSDSDLVGHKLIIGSANIIRQYTFTLGISKETPEGADINVFTGGSFGQNIDIIARALVRYINTDPDSEVNAYYESTDTTLPGLILLENKDLQDITIYLAVNDEIIKNKFNPELPVIVSPTTTNIVTSPIFSDNETAPNRIFFSKVDQPESVPILNYLNVGPKDKAILRILSLRDSLFVLKEDGVYTVTGASAPNFSVKLLDPSTQILAPDSAAILNNKIYCLSSQGIVTVTDTGVQVVSRSIENLIKNVTTPDYNYKYASFGIAYENDRAYMLWLPQLKNDVVATQAIRYNMFTNTWTRWVKTSTCGVINSFDHKMYLGSGDHNDVEQERKNNDRTDYADRSFDIFMLSTNNIIGNEILMGNVAGVSKGDVLYQEQYVTISFFNRLLKKLDLDKGLDQSIVSGGIGYYNTLHMNLGANLRTHLQNLDTMLQNDPKIGIYVPSIFSADFENMQRELNDIINQLNGITGTALKNYTLSIGTTYYEAVILNINTFQNRLEIVSPLPLLYGTEDQLEVYKSIPTTIIWSPTHFGIPNKSKQIRDATILFDQNNFFKASVAYMSDLSRNFEEIEFRGRGIGVWGLMPWGEFIWGGQGSDAPFRTLIPQSKQRCRYITCRFRHNVARERFRLLGMSFEPREVSERAYR